MMVVPMIGKTGLSKKTSGATDGRNSSLLARSSANCPVVGAEGSGRPPYGNLMESYGQEVEA